MIERKSLLPEKFLETVDFLVGIDDFFRRGDSTENDSARAHEVAAGNFREKIENVGQIVLIEGEAAQRIQNLCPLAFGKKEELLGHMGRNVSHGEILVDLSA